MCLIDAKFYIIKLTNFPTNDSYSVNGKFLIFISSSIYKNSMAAAVAVISKENYPLYVKTSAPGNDLKFLYTIHTSLDVIEEKVLTVNKTASDLRELYLGLLYPTEDYKVYGYVTNTKIKFIVVVESSHTTLRDNEIRQMFRRIHAGYADMVCNPFYAPGEVIASKSFEGIIKSIMSTE